ncbi:MAG: fibronectin type III domain-containing protein [Spirochaetaceae bacterium]|nr:MAG: fibronectin type III domain-containing protein [Spirochaetaceae bacterium]
MSSKRKNLSARGRTGRCLGTMLLIAYAALWLSGCFMVLGELRRTGELSINVGVIESERAGVNPASFLPDSYLFTGTGPDGKTFSITSADGSVTVPALVAGVWVVQVTVFNSDGVAVLTGESTVTVEPDSELSLTMELDVVEGAGSLQLDLGWNPAHTVTPYAELQLVSADGESAAYAIPIQSPGSATRLVSDIPAGVYTYSVVLLDSGQPVMGRADTVRILAGVTAVVSYEFSEINKAGLAVPVSASEFTIAWNPPFTGSPEYYRLHYREHGSYTWHALVDAPAQPEPSFTITDAMLAYGTYELAVSSVSGGTESALHSSMSDDAEPGSGWYVVWTGP